MSLMFIKQCIITRTAIFQNVITMKQHIDWQQLLVGDENWDFLSEIVLRTGLMIIIIILALRVLGKRGVKQLSIFELVVIISFGSAAGDPMIYKEIGILTAAIVLLVIILVYKILVFFIGRNKTFEHLMEGRPICLIRDGKFSMQNFKKESMGSHELYSALRLKGVSQLGQVQTAIEEISGDISVFFYEDKEVKYGLPIMPDILEQVLNRIPSDGYYACTHCGAAAFKTQQSTIICNTCGKSEWLPASNSRRVT